MTSTQHRQPSSRQLFRNAAVTFVTVLLAFAAFDDITTDRDTNFTVEWAALAVCVACMLAVTWHLLRSGHRKLGSVSLVVLSAAVIAAIIVTPGVDAFQVEYLMIIAGLLWFLALGGILAVLAWRRTDRHAT